MLIVALLYMAMMALCCRAEVYHHAKMWPILDWSGSDTALAILMSMFWFIILPLIWWDLFRLKHPAKPNPSGLFQRWAEQDRKR